MTTALPSPSSLRARKSLFSGDTVLSQAWPPATAELPIENILSAVTAAAVSRRSVPGCSCQEPSGFCRFTNQAAPLFTLGVTAGVTGGVATTLLNDTDGASQFYGLCHDVDRFAFMAFPSSLNSGKLLFVVNEDNTIWKYNLPAAYSSTFTGTSGASTDSTSATTGTGLAPEFTVAAAGTGTFPAAPASVGCSKMD